MVHPQQTALSLLATCIAQVMESMSSEWTAGESVGFNDWCKLCHRVRSSEVGASLALVQHDEMIQLQNEFKECWGPNSEGVVDESRIRQMIEGILKPSLELQSIPRHVVRLFGCLSSTLDVGSFLSQVRRAGLSGL